MTLFVVRSLEMIIFFIRCQVLNVGCYSGMWSLLQNVAKTMEIDSEES